MTLRIGVPATLGNLGSGYDTLGLAVDLANRFEFEVGPWSVDGVACAPEQNVVLASARHAARRYGGREIQLRLTVDEVVPRSRGLGSSATARVAGLLAGIASVGAEVPVDEQLRWLSEAEGHPDNAWPARLGGLVVCGSRPRHAPLDPRIAVAACIPSVEVDTPRARAALPAVVTHRDAVRTLGALATLMVGLADGDAEALREGVVDRLHQPWRAPLIGPVHEAFARASALGGAPFIGGSGSTLAAFVVEPASVKAVAEALAAPFLERGIPCSTRALRPDLRGATVAGTLDPPAS